MKADKVTPLDLEDALKEQLSVDSNEGVLRVKGERFCLVSPTMVVAFQKQLEALMGKPAKAPIYMAGENAALARADFYREILSEAGLDGGDGREVMDHLSHTMAGYGHGAIEIRSFDRERLIMKVSMRHSFLAEGYGPSDTPVCHFYAGYTAGLAKAILGKDVHCEEVSCVAMGAKSCEFHVAPLEDFANILSQVMSAPK